MIITRELQKDGNIEPESYNILFNLPKDSLNYNKFPERHPLGIYNYSFTRILKSFLFVIEQLEVVEKDLTSKLSFESIESTKEIDLLAIFQTELLHSLHAHIDDCFRILKSISHYPKQEKIDALPKHCKDNINRSAERWVQCFHFKVWENFQTNIQDYRSNLGKIVNKIKHNNARIRLISINMEGFPVIGYYVEGIELNDTEQIVTCPDTQIHPNYTAFSFNRDLKFHFYNIYEISKYLREALILLLKKQNNNHILDLNIYAKSSNLYLDNVLKKIVNLDMAFFPDEYEKQLPKIIIHRHKEDSKLILKFTGNPIVNPINNKVKYINVEFFQEMDSRTELVKRPYINYFLMKGIKMEKIEFFDQ